MWQQASELLDCSFPGVCFSCLVMQRWRSPPCRYTVETLQRRVLKRWWFNASVYMKVQARKSLGLVKGLQDQIAQQQADMNSLQLQLVETRRSLVAEKQGRDMLTQDMKRSFMRGVCALNLEAMQVNQHPQRQNARCACLSLSACNDCLAVPAWHPSPRPTCRS